MVWDCRLDGGVKIELTELLQVFWLNAESNCYFAVYFAELSLLVPLAEFELTNWSHNTESLPTLRLH